jgi:hypothetical protein
MGPGEFEGLAGIARYRDGLVVWDQTLLRLSVLDSNGASESSTRVTPPTRRRSTLLGAVGNAALFRFWEMGLAGAGSFGPAEVRREDTFALVRLTDGIYLRADTLPGEEVWAMREGDRGLHGGIPVLFGANASGAAVDGRTYIGSGDHPVLRVFTDEADQGTANLDRVSIPVRGAWVRWAEDTIRARIDATEPGQSTTNDGRNFRMAGADFRRKLLSDLPARSVLPAFSRLIGGFDGHLWVREYPVPMSDVVGWVAFDSDIRPRRRVVVPTDVEILDFDRDRALVMERGAYGEALVRVYRFEP